MLDLIKFILIGIVISLPVGPTTLLALHRVVKYGFWAGFMTGMGLVITDLIYSTVSVLGISLFSFDLTQYKTPLKLVSFVILLLVAIMIYRNEVKTAQISEKKLKRINIESFLTVFAYSIVTPASLIFFLSLVAGNVVTPENKLLFPIGIFIGELTFWLVISLVFMRIKERVNIQRFRNFNKIIAILIIALATVILFV